MVLTDAFGWFLTPLGSSGIAVVTGKETVSRQRVALVADVLHCGAHNQSRTRHHPAAVLYHARVWA